MPEWMLTDEQMRQAWLDAEHIQGFNPTLAQYPDEELEHDRSFAQAQAKKLWKWGEEECTEHTIYVNHIRQLLMRKNCSSCWTEVKRQVGLG